MAPALGIPQSFLCGTSNGSKIKLCSNISDGKTSTSQTQTKKRCLRCNTLYTDKDNSPSACSFHGHTTGERGLFAMAPPHQGIDGEWSDRSGVIVYRWNEKTRDQTLEVGIGRRDGAVVKSMMKMPHLAKGDAMFPMMMASLCIS